MNRRLLPVILVAAPLLASGCASISKKDCVAGDWAGLGYADGAAGRSEALFADHVKACAKVDVVPDETPYRRAYEQGLREAYCTPEKGYSEGRRNADYEGVCPAELEGGFVRQYLDGLDQKLLQLDIEYENTRGTLEADRIRRAGLGEQEVPKTLRNSIDHGESRVSTLNSERLAIRAKISRWRREL